jgi:hypothetical protein
MRARHAIAVTGSNFVLGGGVISQGRLLGHYFPLKPRLIEIGLKLYRLITSSLQIIGVLKPRPPAPRLLRPRNRTCFSSLGWSAAVE